MRNVTYLTRDLTHEGGGHQHLNKVFSSSNASAHSQEHAHAPHRGRGQAHGYGAADEVHVIGPGSGAGAGGEGQEQKHDYYDLSFLAALNEEDKLIILKDATSSSAVLCAGEAEGEDNEAEEEGSLASSLMQEFWSAVSGTGVQVTTTLDAEL
eukprot:CAMPEP_0170394856 /NCGR_PEP_ID=MMETSP0117_2-20130122/21474_1 /TAXON_ID=400756 /ORGANISM="Durinskia baltica, Strain CSIRO CS-38" /LENGTH=152 /DNA_ID=CAMNT_0010651139 /DNA_START=440 /DNA_END=898 /DNA_ORIENTATION=-